MKWVKDDGGRAVAGFKGETRDCTTRAISIVLDKPYREVYSGINEAAKHERPCEGKRRSWAASGVRKATARRYIKSLGFVWAPTMQIGSGCKVHLCADELPSGRLIVSVSRHLTAVINGVIHDTHDCSRNDTRCVYGYWVLGSRGEGT